MEVDINLIEILQEASKSPLGIIALVILSMSVVGVILFRNAEVKYKFGVFIILFIGIVTFTYASLQIVQPTPTELYDVASVPENSGTGPSPSAQSLLTQEGQHPPQNESAQKLEDQKTQLPVAKHEQGFIYLGTFRSGKWSDPRFIGAEGELKVGEVLTLSDARKMFECAPYRKSLFSLSYTFCNDVIGSVDEGGKVEVLKPPLSVGLDRIWVYVKKVE